MCCRQKNVSPFTPHPRSRLSIPEQNVRDGVDVWRDVQSPPQEIVARVDDDGEFFRWKTTCRRPIDEFRSAPCHRWSTVITPALRESARGFGRVPAHDRPADRAWRFTARENKFRIHRQAAVPA